MRSRSTFSTTSALFRARSVSKRCCALSARLLWMSGVLSARRLVAIALACGIRSSPRPQAGRPHACLLTAGQTAGGINDVLSVGDIMRRLIAETEAALSRAPGLEAALQSGRAA